MALLIAACQNDQQADSSVGGIVAARDEEPSPGPTKTCSCTCTSYDTDAEGEPLREEGWSWVVKNSASCPKNGQTCGWKKDHVYGKLHFCSEFVNPPKAEALIDAEEVKKLSTSFGEKE